MAGQKQRGKGTKKYGRNSATCTTYLNQNKREKNKAAKQARIQRGFRKAV